MGAYTGSMLASASTCSAQQYQTFRPRRPINRRRKIALERNHLTCIGCILGWKEWFAVNSFMYGYSFAEWESAHFRLSTNHATEQCIEELILKIRRQDGPLFLKLLPMSCPNCTMTQKWKFIHLMVTALCQKEIFFLKIIFISFFLSKEVYST